MKDIVYRVVATDMIRRDPNTEIYRIRLWVNVIDSKKNHLFRSPDWLAVEGKMCTEKNVDFMMAQVRYVIEKITFFSLL